MKQKTFPLIAVNLIYLGLFALPAIAEDGHAHDAAAAIHQDAEKHEGKGPESAALPAEVIKQIHELQTKLAATVSSKKLEDVHHTAFAIRDLAASLPSKVQAEKRAKLEATAKNIAAIAAALDESGDANDQSKTEANLKKLDGLVKMLESQV